jgi:N-acetylmuramic acid 6-phosphate (MurNAc-6-P) etherase
MSISRFQMVDVRSSNFKLVNRARRIFRSVLEPLSHPPYSISLDIDLNSDSEIDALVNACGGNTKQAIVAARWSCAPDEAAKRLEAENGVLKKALFIAS